MAGRLGQKMNQDEVHQNQIMRELFLKEFRTQKLYTQYHVNPLRKGEQAQEGWEGWESKHSLSLIISLEFRQLSFEGISPQVTPGTIEALKCIQN